jgi:hypothetical protein
LGEDRGISEKEVATLEGLQTRKGKLSGESIAAVSKFC